MTIFYRKEVYDFFYETARALCESRLNYHELQQSLRDLETRACRSFVGNRAYFARCKNLLRDFFVDGHILESFVAINKALSRLPFHKPINHQNEYMLLDHVWNMRRLFFSHRYILNEISAKDALTVAYMVPRMLGVYIRILNNYPHSNFKPAAHSIFFQEVFLETVKIRICIVHYLLQETFLQSKIPHQEVASLYAPRTVNITLDLLVLQRAFPEIVRSHFAGKAVFAEHQIAVLYEAIGKEHFRNSLFAKITNINLDDGQQVALYYALYCHKELELQLDRIYFNGDDEMENVESISIVYLILIHKKIIKLVHTNIYSTYKRYIEALKICCLLTGDYTFASFNKR